MRRQLEHTSCDCDDTIEWRRPTQYGSLCHKTSRSRTGPQAKRMRASAVHEEHRQQQQAVRTSRFQDRREGLCLRLKVGERSVQLGRLQNLPSYLGSITHREAALFFFDLVF